MAKVLFTAVVADMRGKLAGTVFTKNRGGAVARTKVSPVNRRTTSQQTRRSVFGNMSSAWRALTEAQRQSWIEGAPGFARTDQFKNQKVLSGQQLFVGLNSNLQKIGKAMLSVCPVPQGAPVEWLDPPSFAVKVGNGTTTVDRVSVSLVGANIIAHGYDVVPYVRFTRPMSQGVNNPTGSFKHVTTNTPATDFYFGSGDPGEFMPGYGFVFGGIPPIGSKVFMEVTGINADTGEAGAPIIVSATSVAA